MFILYADKTRLRVREREAVTSGSVNVCPVRLELSEEWEGLEKTVIFRAGTESRAVLPDEAGECVIPWEVLAAANVRLFCGVYGTSGGHTVLPTIWADLGIILEGATPAGGICPHPPTPELWEQELAKKQDKLAGQPGQVVGFDENGNAVPQDGGKGGISPDMLATDEEVNEMLNEAFSSKQID